MWREGSGEGKQNVDLLRTVCSRLPSEHTDLELGFRSRAPAPLITMFGNAYSAEGNFDNGEGQTQEQLQQNPHIITVSIPKVEPYYPSSSDTDDNVSNDVSITWLQLYYVRFYNVCIFLMLYYYTCMHCIYVNCAYVFTVLGTKSRFTFHLTHGGNFKFSYYTVYLVTRTIFFVI